MTHPLSKTLHRLGTFWTLPQNTNPFRLALLLVALQFFLIFYYFDRLPPQVPLYFSLPWGENRLSTPSNLLLFPSLGLIFLIFNSFFAGLLSEDHKLLQHTCLIISLLFSLFASLALIFILRLVL